MSGPWKIARCKDYVGRLVRLLREVRTNGGHVFPAGHVMECRGTWRGRFNLDDLKQTVGPGWSTRKGVSRVSRNSFEVLSDFDLLEDGKPEVVSDAKL